MDEKIKIVDYAADVREIPFEFHEVVRLLELAGQHDVRQIPDEQCEFSDSGYLVVIFDADEEVTDEELFNALREDINKEG